MRPLGQRTGPPPQEAGWAKHPYIDAAHRIHARVEDAIRTGKDCGLGHFPSRGFAFNQAWLTAAMTGQILLAWLKLLALDGDLVRAEPKTLRYRVLHAAARLVRGGRRRYLKIQATWPWADAIAASVAAQRQSTWQGRRPDQQKLSLRSRKENSRGLWNPGYPARQPGHCHTPAQKFTPRRAIRHRQRQPSTPMKDQG